MTWHNLRIPSASVAAIRQNILDACGGSPEAAMELVGRIGWLMENSLSPAVEVAAKRTDWSPHPHGGKNIGGCEACFPSGGQT